MTPSLLNTHNNTQSSIGHTALKGLFSGFSVAADAGSRRVDSAANAVASLLRGDINVPFLPVPQTLGVIYGLTSHTAVRTLMDVISSVLNIDTPEYLKLSVTIDLHVFIGFSVYKFTKFIRASVTSATNSHHRPRSISVAISKFIAKYPILKNILVHGCALGTGIIYAKTSFTLLAAMLRLANTYSTLPELLYLAETTTILVFGVTLFYASLFYGYCSAKHEIFVRPGLLGP